MSSHGITPPYDTPSHTRTDDSAPAAMTVPRMFPTEVCAFQMPMMRPRLPCRVGRHTQEAQLETCMCVCATVARVQACRRSAQSNCQATCAAQVTTCLAEPVGHHTDHAGPARGLQQACTPVRRGQETGGCDPDSSPTVCLPVEHMQPAPPPGLMSSAAIPTDPGTTPALWLHCICPLPPCTCPLASHSLANTTRV